PILLISLLSPLRPPPPSTLFPYTTLFRSTLIGLDSHGRALNAASSETPAYSIGGLPPYTTFNLAVWNGDGAGENSIAGALTTNRSEEHTSELQSRFDLVCRLLLEKKKKNK